MVGVQPTPGPWALRARRSAAGEQAPDDAIPSCGGRCVTAAPRRSDAFWHASCKPLSFKDMPGLRELILSRALPVTDPAVSALSGA